jgi:hypothetical protein
MTKSTLNTLWLAAGGLLATWLAVAPAPTTAVSPSVDRVVHATNVTETALDDLSRQSARLRQQNGSAVFRASTRNPFRFATPPARRAAVAPAAIAPASPALPVEPPLSLAGVATDHGKRTAIISGDGQVYLAGEGDTVAGRFHVVKVDSDAVTLRDENGVQRRLVLKF